MKLFEIATEITDAEYARRIEVINHWIDYYTEEGVSGGLSIIDWLMPTDSFMTISRAEFNKIIKSFNPIASFGGWRDANNDDLALFTEKVTDGPFMMDYIDGKTKKNTKEEAYEIILKFAIDSGDPTTSTEQTLRENRIKYVNNTWDEFQALIHKSHGNNVTYHTILGGTVIRIVCCKNERSY